MELYTFSLIITTVLVGLIAGLFFTFSVMIMPGLARLSDKHYIRSFQAIDKVVQNTQPSFATTPIWGTAFVGAIVGIGATLLLSLGADAAKGADVTLLSAAAGLYFFGMILPTGRVHLPLNGKLQSLDVDTMNDDQLAQARKAFESRWNRWNTVRTVATFLAFCLVVLCWQL